MTNNIREDFKVCLACGVEKSSADFPRYTYGKYTTVRKQCKPCYSAAQIPKAKARYYAKREQIMAQRKISMEKRKIAGYVPAPRIRKNIEHYAARRFITNAASTSALRKLTFDTYGGCFCACCGESHMLLLSLDHIEGGGNTHRKETNTRGGQKFYRYLKGLEFPPGYQVLCMNCNVGRYRNGGICPHKDLK